MESKLDMFQMVGFFEEREMIIRHLHDFFAVTTEGEVQACIMFGTLLGKLRHDDFIPWDDDVDIVIFDFDTFQQRCVPKLEQKGYIVEPDIRDGKRMGCRIFHENNKKIPSRPALRFPWIGIWEHEVDDEGLIVLPPEKVRYEPADFLPLGRANFLGMSVGIPQNPVNILNTYFGSDDWMDCCVLPERDHRNGGVFTDFPQDKFRLQDVLAHLSRSGERDPRDPAGNPPRSENREEVRDVAPEGRSRSPSTSRTYEATDCASFAICSRERVSGRASKAARRR